MGRRCTSSASGTTVGSAIYAPAHRVRRRAVPAGWRGYVNPVIADLDHHDSGERPCNLGQLSSLLVAVVLRTALTPIVTNTQTRASDPSRCTPTKTGTDQMPQRSQHEWD